MVSGGPLLSDRKMLAATKISKGPSAGIHSDDMELFVEPDDIIDSGEISPDAFKEVLMWTAIPLNVSPYDEAMARYGSASRTPVSALN